MIRHFFHILGVADRIVFIHHEDRPALDPQVLDQEVQRVAAVEVALDGAVDSLSESQVFSHGGGPRRRVAVKPPDGGSYASLRPSG